MTITAQAHHSLNDTGRPQVKDTSRVRSGLAGQGARVILLMLCGDEGGEGGGREDVSLDLKDRSGGSDLDGDEPRFLWQRQHSKLGESLGN